MPTLAIPTYKRQALLYRLLSSLGESEYHNSLKTIYVFDDETSAAPEAKAAVFRANKKYGLSITYRGFYEKQCMAAIIAEGNNDLLSALEFAFRGMKECSNIRADGMNRNAILLHCMGEKTVSADDDTIFSCLRYKNRENFFEKLITNRRYQQIQQQPFFSFSDTGREKYKKHLVNLAENPFLIFNNFLGYTPQDLGYNYPLDGKIRVAMAGIHGGRWYASSMAIFDVNPQNYKLWENKNDYEKAKRTPYALYLFPAVNITPDPFFAAAHFGYYSEDIMPPFLPHIRNDDGIWAYMTRLMYPASPICHLPFAISHGSKTNSPLPDLTAIHAAITANGLLKLLIEYFSNQIQTDDPGKYLKLLGEKLISVTKKGKMFWHDVTTDLYQVMQHRVFQHAEEKNRQIQNAPYFLVRDYQNYLAMIKKERNTVIPWIPEEFKQYGEKGEEYFCKYVERSGHLFYWWPDLWEKAKNKKNSLRKM
jgi:hypothetical protein